MGHPEPDKGREALEHDEVAQGPDSGSLGDEAEDSAANPLMRDRHADQFCGVALAFVGIPER